MNPFTNVPVGVVDIISKLLFAIFGLIKAGDDMDAQEAVLMQAQEDMKAELDRRKFGG